MKKILIALCLLFGLSNCYTDDMTQKPTIVYYNGSYGYWYDDYWYSAPPGYVYAPNVGPYWGPCYHHYYYNRGYYRGGYHGYYGGYGRYHGGVYRGGWHHR